jgi:EmrB/QacA subfamily drug resistance transporter
MALTELPSSRRPVGLVVGVLSLATFMSSLDLFVVNLALPSVAHDYRGASLGSLSWILNGYTVVFAAVLVPAGRLADRVGRRRVFVAGLIVFSAGSVACGSAFGVGSLVAARVLQGFGAGLMVPASLSVLLAAVPGQLRAKAIGTWAAMGGLGGAVAPVAGGLLVQAGWRWIFWINVPAGLIGAVIAARVLPESRDEQQRARPDVLGAVLLAAAVGLLAFALVQAPAWGWASGRFGAAVAGALIAGTLVVLRCRRHPAPVLELGLLRLPSFSGAFLASVLYFAAFGSLVLNYVEFLTGVWHYSALQAGLAMCPGPLLMLPFARVVAPRLVARLGGPAPVAMLGIALNAGAQLLWLSGLQAHPAYLSHLLPVQLIAGSGVGLTTPALLGLGTSALPPARFGTGSGVLNTARQVGITIGVAAFVAILATASHADPVPDFRSGQWLTVGLFAGAGLVVLATLTTLRLTRPPAVPAVPVAATVPSRVSGD